MWMKSLFISAYISALVMGLAAGAYGVWQTQGMGVHWWAVWAALLPALAFFAGLFLRPVPRTSPTPMWPWLGNGLAVLLLVWAGWPAEPWHALALALVVFVGFGGWWLYQQWYSYYGRQRSKSLAVGQQLPAALLERPDGSQVDLQHMTGPLLLMFYRGNWCPLCMAQIREIAGQYRALSQRGVQLVLISGQPHGHTAALASKFDVPFHFLVDVGNRVTQQWGLLARGGTPTGLQALGYDSDTAMPTVVMTDADHTIVFCDETDHYRTRPEPATFLRIWDEHQQRSGR